MLSFYNLVPMSRENDARPHRWVFIVIKSPPKVCVQIRIDSDVDIFFVNGTIYFHGNKLCRLRTDVITSKKSGTYMAKKS